MLRNKQTLLQFTWLAIMAAVFLGCILVIKPFALPIIWAAIITFATWHVYEIILKWVRGRRNLAAAIMSIMLLLILFLPFFLVIMTLGQNVTSGIEYFKHASQQGFPSPPDWIDRIPLVGHKVTDLWSTFQTNAEVAFERIRPRLEDAGLWLLKNSVAFAMGVLQIALSVLIAFFMYRDGEKYAADLQKGFEKIIGDSAQKLLDIAKSTIKSVVYGLLGTALAQGIVAGIGYWIAGIPSPVLLGFFTFFLSFVPAGPAIVWILAAVFLFLRGSIGWGIFMVIYGFFVISSIDNVIKPYIMSRGSKLPFIIMFIGAIGGIMTFGFIGVFIGPTLLTVGYSLAKEILEFEVSQKKQSANQTDVTL